MSNQDIPGSDLTDSPRDAEKLKAETGTLNLPDWKDIPGRKAGPVSTAPGDTTISSSDEEGDGLLDDDVDGEEVDELDKEMLDQPFDPAYDADLSVGDISLDETDEDGDRLEEDGPKQSLFGSDLDDSLEQEQDEEDEDVNGNRE